MPRPKGSKNKPKPAEIDPVQTASADLVIVAETLRGDIRDYVLREFKAVPKPWAQMNETEQERLIYRAGDIAQSVVNQAVQIAAHRGAPHVVAEVTQFIVKDGLKILLTGNGTVENIVHLAEHAGAAVLVLIEPSKYHGERKKAETDVVGDLAMPKIAADEANLKKLEITLNSGLPSPPPTPTPTPSPA